MSSPVFSQLFGPRVGGQGTIRTSEVVVYSPRPEAKVNSEVVVVVSFRPQRGGGRGRVDLTAPGRVARLLACSAPPGDVCSHRDAQHFQSHKPKHCCKYLTESSQMKSSRVKKSHVKSQMRMTDTRRCVSTSTSAAAAGRACNALIDKI